jgi:hypothetical protein
LPCFIMRHMLGFLFCLLYNISYYVTLYGVDRT